MRWLSSFICAKVCFLPRGWPIFFVLCQENYKKNADRWRLHIMLNHHFELQEHKIKHSLGHSGKNITSQAADTPTETPEISESGSQLCVKSQTMTSGLASPQRNLGQGCHSRLCLPIWDSPRVVLAFHYINDRSQGLQCPPWWISFPPPLPILTLGKNTCPSSRIPKLTPQRLSGGIMWNKSEKDKYCMISLVCGI